MTTTEATRDKAAQAESIEQIQAFLNANFTGVAPVVVTEVTVQAFDHDEALGRLTYDPNISEYIFEPAASREGR